MSKPAITPAEIALTLIYGLGRSPDVIESVSDESIVLGGVIKPDGNYRRMQSYHWSLTLTPRGEEIVSEVSVRDSRGRAIDREEVVASRHHYSSGGKRQAWGQATAWEGDLHRFLPITWPGKDAYKGFGAPVDHQPRIGRW